MATNRTSLFIGWCAGVATCTVWLFAWLAGQQGPRPGGVAPVALPSKSQESAHTTYPEIVQMSRHRYDSKDGVNYGYTAALTPEQRQRGQVTPTIAMFTYAGSHDGRHQMHFWRGQALVAFECAPPCNVIKVMSTVDTDETRGLVEVDHLRATPDAVASMALNDAMEGHLEPYAEYHGKARYEVWVDESKGILRHRISDAPTKAASAGR